MSDKIDRFVLLLDVFRACLRVLVESLSVSAVCCAFFLSLMHPCRSDDQPVQKEQIVTPWDVQGSVSTDGKQQAIDYDKLIDQFGTRRIDQTLLERFEKLTGHRPHVFLRRGMFFSHRSVLFDWTTPRHLEIHFPPANLTRFSTDMNRENLFISTQGGVQVATACIWDI